MRVQTTQVDDSSALHPENATSSLYSAGARLASSQFLVHYVNNRLSDEKLPCGRWLSQVHMSMICSALLNGQKKKLSLS